MRQCGECSLCCELVQVNGEGWTKPAGTKCQFQCGAAGCAIYGQPERPEVCKSYQCVWLRGYGEENDRPDRIGCLVTFARFNGGRWIFAQDIIPNAHLGPARNLIVQAMRDYHFPVIVSDATTPSGEDYGDYVILHKRMMPRAGRIAGKFLGRYAGQLDRYELKVS